MSPMPLMRFHRNDRFALIEVAVLEVGLSAKDVPSFLAGMIAIDKRGVTTKQARVSVDQIRCVWIGLDSERRGPHNISSLEV